MSNAHKTLDSGTTINYNGLQSRKGIEYKSHNKPLTEVTKYNIFLKIACTKKYAIYMPKDKDKDLEYFVKKYKLNKEERYEFSRYIHELKRSGDRGRKNQDGDFTMEELEEILKELRGIE